MSILSKKDRDVLPRPTEGQRRQLARIAGEIGKGVIVLLIIIAAFKFISWNYFKLVQAADVTNVMLSAPAAVNLTLTRENTTLYRRSFPFNRNGNIYLDNRFDITPYLSDESIRLTVNHRPPETLRAFRAFRFTRFNILYSEDFCFVFTTPGCKIEDLVRLRDTAPFIPGALSKLAVDMEMETGEKHLIHRLFEDSEKILKYHGGRFSLALPAPVNDSEIYEVTFEYNVTGKARPIILLTAGPHPKENIFFHRLLDTSKPGCSRKISLLVPSLEKPVPSAFQIIARYPRSSRHRNGAVHIRNLTLYRYTLEGIPVRPRVAYLDIAGKLKNDLIECR